MSRPRTGTVIEPNGRRKSYAIRFTANGKRHTVRLGTPEEGWTRSKAEEELRYTLADVERGRWQPTPTRKEPKEVPTFQVFATEWLAGKEAELSENGIRAYRWAIELHLLPYFADHPLTDIDIESVDRYRTHKVRQDEISPRSINKTISVLSSILELAVEYGIIPANPAAGRRRRLKAGRPNRPWVQPEQLPALLDAAGSLESEYRTVGRVILATLAGAGLRIGEALDLRWRDVNLGNRTIRVRESKTEAGVREVDLSLALAEELADLKAKLSPVSKDDPVFASTHYGRRDPSRPAQLDRHRVRERILKPAVRIANEKLEERGIDPMGQVTLHGLRRTFASLCFADGQDPVYVASQLGHTDPTFSIQVYAKAVKRRERLSGETLKAFDEAIVLAHLGSNSPDGSPFDPPRPEADGSAIPMGGGKA